jgi:uncharacterized membrane protein
MRPRHATKPALVPLGDLAWSFFLVFTAAAAVVLPGVVDETAVRGWVRDRGLQETLVSLLGLIDPVWITLAAVNTYLHVTREEVLATARRWGLIVLIGSAMLAWCGAVSGWPFGPLRYTDRLGARLGGVLPFALPLFWLAVVFNSRYLVLGCRPRAGRWLLAAGTGLLALLTDLNLETVAWKVRAYWVWYPGQLTFPAWPPLQNFVAWFGAAFLLSLCLTETRVAGQPRCVRPALILGLLNAVFLGVHVARWLRG